MPVEDPKKKRWGTGDPEWFITICVPRANNESTQDWCDRFDDIVSAAELEFPPNP